MAHNHASEEEPLLGQPGDASQQDRSIVVNLWLGTAVLAQAGIWIMTAIIWAAVFQVKVELFSAHPLLNTAGLLLVTQAILLLQPTHTATQKAVGTQLHAAIHGVGVLVLLAGLIVIEYNKFSHDGAHFGAVHNILGLATYILLGLQSLVGVTQYWAPGLYGGESNAKRVYKFHRMGGYLTLVAGLATVCAVVETPYNENVLHLKMWTVVVASLLTLLGVAPRIKLQKLGLKQA